VVEVDLSAARNSRPAPGVLEALDDARAILICPSNPIVSIGTIRAVPGVEGQLRARRCAVAISPIIAGAPVKGPADRLLRAEGTEVSAVGVATIYREIARAMILDHADAALAPRVEALDLRVGIEETLMRSPEVSARLARAALDLAETSP
jgi:LPPG:FO 2-phospho-L-lactate transferase